MIPDLTTTTLFTGVGDFLKAVLPAGTRIVRGQVNRVPEPKDANFAVMWELRRQRLATNVDVWADAVFTGSIAGTTMTVTSVQQGSVIVGRSLFGVDVAAGSRIVAAQATPGLYTVSPSQNVSSRKLAAGAIERMQETHATLQIDLHGPGSSDNAQVLSTAFRSEYATQFFTDLGTGISPLHADDPRQMPFFNAEQQVETRWIVEAHVQIDPTIATPQQFMDEIEADLVDATANYPA